MKTRVRKFKALGLYSLSGQASANSLFFEDAADQRLFLQLLDRFLGEMIVLYGYSTTPTSWTIFFKTKDSKSITQAFLTQKKTSKKLKDSAKLLDTGFMLAEHFRYFLSSYVKQSNFRHQRHGSRIHSKMKKYIFESYDDLQLEIDDMKKLKETKVQKSKYRPNMNHYLVEKQLKRESIWRQSFVGINGEKLVQAVIPCFQWILDKAEVLRQLVHFTWKLHFGPINPQNSTPQLE